MNYKIINGDCLHELTQLPGDHFDASLSDPPYGLSFMGKEWDKGVPSAAVYEQLLRVLKPGAFAMAFGGTRTVHRLACNIEDAGFEVRDTIAWLYGSGFPKSHNISKAIDKAAGAERTVLGERRQRGRAAEYAPFQKNTSASPVELLTAPATPAAVQWNGYGTALKPAHEPCLLVQKPLDKTFANNVLTHGCGALNIDGCRVATDDNLNGGSYPEGDWTASIGQEYVGGHKRVPGAFVQPTGRFPANLILDEEAAAALDASAAPTESSKRKPERAKERDSGFIYPQARQDYREDNTYGGQGGVSRFFYCAKVGTKERNAGCDGWPEHQTYGGDAPQPMQDQRENKPRTNNHPTMKPLALTTYLAKLLLPPKQEGKVRRIIVPYSGSGSEMIGCLLAGWDEVWGIELDPNYAEIAKARIHHWTQGQAQSL